MNKPKIKSYLHLALLVIVLAGAAYVAFRQGVSITEKIGAFGVLAAASLMALGKILPTVNKAIDELPDDEQTPRNITKMPPPSPGTPVVAILALGTALLLAGPARAQSPQFGGCLTPSLCAGPSASVTVVSFNLADSTFSGGVSPGLGYGLTWTPPAAPWAAMGADLYASFRLGQGLPNQASFALMGHFADYLFLGVGPTVTQRAGQSALVQWSILGGMGVPLGGTPSYLANQRAR